MQHIGRFKERANAHFKSLINDHEKFRREQLVIPHNMTAFVSKKDLEERNGHKAVNIYSSSNIFFIVTHIYQFNEQKWR